MDRRAGQVGIRLADQDISCRDTRRTLCRRVKPNVDVRQKPSESTGLGDRYLPADGIGHPTIVCNMGVCRNNLLYLIRQPCADALDFGGALGRVDTRAIIYCCTVWLRSIRCRPLMDEDYD